MNNRKTERVTKANFDAQRYIAVNQDVARYVKVGGDARQHLIDYGLAEGRRQLTSEAFVSVQLTAADRYRRFLPLLHAKAGSGGEFRFAGEENAFPLLYGNSTYDLASYQSESANVGFGPFTLEMIDNPDKNYADIGCGRRNVKQDNCLYVEVYPSVSADLIVEPGSRYPIASGSLDGIGCFAVLEHVEEPWKVVEEFSRMLKPGGKVFIDWPFLQPVHGYPSHYYNATRAGLERMFVDDYDIEILDTYSNQTPAHTITWYLNVLMQDLAANNADLHQKMLDAPVSQLLHAAPTGPFWTEIVGHLTPHTIMTLACGNSLVARKK